MVIWFAFQDGHGTVDLLSEEETYHLMVESHLGKGYFLVSPSIDRIRKSVWATDHENESFLAGKHSLLNEISKLQRRWHFTPLIEQSHKVGWGEGSEKSLALCCLLLGFSEFTGILDIRNVFDRKLDIPLETATIVVDSSLYISRGSFTDCGQ